MNKPEHLFIDLDNTLYDYDKAHNPANLKLMEQLSQELFMSISEVETEFNKAKTSLKVRLGKIASSHSRLLYISELLKGFQIANKMELALSLEQCYWRTFLANSELHSGVKEFLTLARLHGTKIILVTDLQNTIQYRKLNWFGISSLLDLVITSEEAGGDKVSGKPQNYLSLLLDNPTPNGWCVGDMSWDHLFNTSTKFFHFSPGAPNLANPESGGVFGSYEYLSDLYNYL